MYQCGSVCVAKKQEEQSNWWGAGQGRLQYTGASELNLGSTKTH